MKNLVILLILSVQAFFCSKVLFAQQIDFIQSKNSAGKASLTSNAYYVNNVIGVANFSPELKFPIQICYDSSVKEEGLIGTSWRIPQLESSAIPNENGALWTTPWGEKVFFYSRKNTSKEILNLYNEKERENAYFSPFADWTANGRANSGSWTIYGRNDMRGWKFTYLDAKLRKIEAPSGKSISFTYSNDRLISVEQQGRAFIELKYNRDKILGEILINGVSNKLDFVEASVRILPETLAGKEVRLETFFLSSIGREGLNPVEFSYNQYGHLTRIVRGEYIDKISVETESLVQRKAYLKQIAIAQKNKKSTNDIHPERIDGRILSDSQFKYSYPTNKIGNVELLNNMRQRAKYSYDGRRGISTKRDFSGREISTYYFMRYDVAYNGKVRQIVDARKRVLASYRYDKDSGKIIRSRDLAKNDINFKYDKLGNLILITKRAVDDSAERPVRSFEYFKGNLNPTRINELDEKGEAVKSTSVQYDKSLRPIVIDNGEKNLKIFYNSYGYCSKTINTFGQETTYVYDKYNRILSQRSNGIDSVVEYNANGFPIKYSKKIGNELITSLEIAYNKDGYPVSYKDQDGIVKNYERNEYGRVVTEIFPDNTKVQYQYDAIGRLANVVDQSSHEIKFAWNQYGLASKVTAVGQISQNTYDSYGRLKTVDSKFADVPSVRAFEYKYDDFDRVTEIKYGKNEVEALKYDSWGHLIERRKNARFTYFKYDYFGRLSEKREDGLVTKYTYDASGRRLCRSTNRDKDIWNETNSYDKYGRLIKTETEGKSVEYIYNDNNQLVEQILDDNKIKFTYTKLGQLESKILFDKDGKELSELRYYYSKSGKILSRLANGKLQGYKYDSKNQLLAVVDLETNTLIEEYTYDATGNVLRKAINGKTTTYTYDDANQLVSSISPDGKQTHYAYDAAGRMIKEGNKTYEYAWLDKVVRVRENGKVVSQFEYHNNGQIAKSIRPDKTENFLWDGLALVKRGDTKYINEPHVGGGNPVLAINEDSSEKIFTDILGTSLGKEANNEYFAIDKTSFGADSSDKDSFFTGKPYVENLGYVFLLRNYRADTGKWLSQDLVGYPDGWNNLAYCCNRVMLAYDRLGAAVGDIYPSADAAAVAWGKEFNGRSISEGRELGSSIYENGNGYSYTEPAIGGNSFTGISPAPEGKKTVADIHSHGKYERGHDNDNFSDVDTDGNDRDGIDGYVTTPDGSLKKYDHETKKISTLSNDMPHDPKHPKYE